jgi:hypothetical protein
MFAKYAKKRVGAYELLATGKGKRKGCKLLDRGTETEFGLEVLKLEPDIDSDEQV